MTGLGEEKLWIQTSCRSGEGWALPGCSCLSHTTWVVSPTTKPGYGIMEKNIKVLNILGLPEIYMSTLMETLAETHKQTSHKTNVFK